MAARSIPRRCKVVTAAVGLLVAGSACTGKGAASHTAPTSPEGRGTLGVLQMNLCDSGIATCYTGRSVGEAAAVIRDRRPDIVTLNEVCRADVSALERAMSAIDPGIPVASAFKAAGDRRTNGPYRCRSGQPYGIGVVARLRASRPGFRTYGGRYPVQDLSDPEERVWLCIHAAAGFYACTTHTASTSRAVALAQCRYLLGRALPALLRRHGAGPVVVGADLNLPTGDSPDAASCLMDGYQRADDGSRQDVIASPGLTVAHRAIIDLRGTTDHPGLLVALSR